MKSTIWKGAVRTATAVVLVTVASGLMHAQQQTCDGGNLRFGIVAGAGFNTSNVAPQRFIRLDADPNFASYDLSNPSLAVPYGGFMAEYLATSFLGAHLRVSYDDRSVAKTDADRELTVRMSYVAIEPGLRMALTDHFHFLIGPSILFNTIHEYDFSSGTGESTVNLENMTLDNTREAAIGLWGEFGYDIPLSDKSACTQWFLSPFISAAYVADLKTPDTSVQGFDGSWNTLTPRAGLKLIVGSGPKQPELITTDYIPSMEISIAPPRNGVAQPRQLIEQFPLMSYIFFDEGSNDIPQRYVRLNPADAVGFSESTLPEAPGAGGSGRKTRAARQMAVYHNALNIIGARLKAHPEARITLVGSAPNQSEGLAYANTTREYLTKTFDISPDRIETRGQTKPPHASGTRATPKDDLPLVAEENLRVEVLAENAAIIEPVEVRTLQEEPIDNDLVVNVRSGSTLENWNVRIVGEGFDKTYGPFVMPTMRINATPILGSRARGVYQALVTGTTRAGQTLKNERSFELIRTEQPPVETDRYSILFEFDESKTVAMYEEFLRTKVAPRIPNGAAVFIHGHTDIVGEEGYNSELSVRRTFEAEKILKEEMERLGRRVVFDSYGFGEVDFRSPFGNESPEGRYYNRTVVIDIIPGS